MAETENTGTVVQAWVRPEFAREIKELAEQDNRSVSNLIKLALRERLQADARKED
jgi:Ribbon-helix-helix protein, copG family